MQKQIKKILILRFSSIGDIVLTTPVIRCVKQQLDGVEIHFGTKKPFAGLMRSNSYVDKVHVLDGSEKEFISGLKKEGFDVVLDLHNNLRTKRIKWSLRIKSYVFNKLNWRKFLLVKFKVNKMPDVHIVDRYMRTAEELGVKNDFNGLDYFIPEEDVIKLDAFLPENYRHGFVTFALGGQHETKRLPVKKMIELCKSIDSPIVLLGGPNDKAEAEMISHHFHDMAKIFNAVGIVNLNQSASLVKSSNALYTHDTGMMHIASGLKKKVVSIWGNTVPEFGMYPYLTEYEIKEVKGLSCRPCSKIGFDKCPQGHFKCMQNQEF